MTKKMFNNLKLGQRYLYTEYGVCLLIEIIAQRHYSWGKPGHINVKVLSKTKNATYHRLGNQILSSNVGTWKYLEGQDKPILKKQDKSIRKR